jgi:hypothetical protein
MALIRRIAIACVLVGALVLGAGTAAASTGTLDVFGDFADNGVIDRPHSFQDLRAALSLARQDAQYTDFANAVSDALDAELLGGGDNGSGGGSAIGSPLPVPRTPDQSGQPPWPFLALSAMAALLVVTGAGSSVYRRARRSP